ncbi:hypothetical protein GW17_00056159 [Ensete ventricosum]|nr:hypothetical protein GW17_00056159 [Ensete ventricosum]
MIQYKRSNSVNDSSIIADLTEIPTLKGSHAAASNGDKSAAHLLSCVDCCTVRRPQQLKTTVTGGMFRASNLAVEGESYKFSSPQRHCPGPAPPSWIQLPTSSSSHETLEDDSDVSIVLPFQRTQPIQTPEKGPERNAREIVRGAARN